MTEAVLEELCKHGINASMSSAAAYERRNLQSIFARCRCFCIVVCICMSSVCAGFSMLGSEWRYGTMFCA